MKIHKRFIPILAAMALLPNLAMAAAPANSVISNNAQLTYSGLSTPLTASVSITVSLDPTAPTLSAPVDKTVAAGQSTVYSYTITSAANGSDAYSLSAVTTPTNLSGTPSISFAQGVTPVTSVTLGATALSSAATAGATVLNVPSDTTADSSVNNIIAGDTVVIGGNPYTVASVNDNGTTATITLNAPGLSASATIGTGIFERQSFTAKINNVGSITGSPATLNMTVTATSITDGAESSNDVTTTAVIEVTFEKFVRNVTNNNGSGPTNIGGTDYYDTAGSVTAESGDVLEYLIRATAPTGTALTGATFQDVIPQFTTYVASSTTLNGNNVTDISGNTPLLGGMPVNDASSPAGTIAAGTTATVTFQVTID